MSTFVRVAAALAAAFVLSCAIGDSIAPTGSGGSVDRGGDTVYVDTSGTLVVPPTDSWVKTAATVRMGDVMSVEASGKVMSVNFGDFGPDGTDTLGGKGFLVRSERGYALCGRIGTSAPPFFIGQSYVGFAGRDGALYLAVNSQNDTIDTYVIHADSGQYVIGSLVVAR